MTEKAIAKRIETEWFDELITDIRNLEYTGIVLTKHAIGKRILQDELKFGKPEYGSKKIEVLAKEINVSSRDLWYCVQFARKCNIVAELQNKSWHWITQNLLPSSSRNDKARKKAKKQGQFNVEIRHGDFREVLNDIEQQSVKLILTDPPYSKEHLDLWSDLGKFADKVLGADGALITYSGQLYLKEVINALSEKLQWWWMSAVIHKGKGNLTPLGQPVRKVINQFKPLLIFVPNESTGIPNVFKDVIKGTGKEKDKHNWQQPVKEAKLILKTFCEKGDLIVDPFAGSGAFGEAARQMKMSFIGADLEWTS